MSFQWDGIAGAGNNKNLWKSPAEAVSPARNDDKRGARPYRSEPPAANGDKVVLIDTDHIWGVGGDVAWVWKSFTRGLHPIFMEPYRNSIINSSDSIEPKWEPVRRAMGHTLSFARRMNLTSMTPHGELASTRFCLANPGEQYVVCFPDSGWTDVLAEAVSESQSVL
ncbi:MAG: hypothetical protein GY758_11985 [Fuerstiella sp.]|nr:hypothetical protein [Fuerstiella sp.]